MRSAFLTGFLASIALAAGLAAAGAQSAREVPVREDLRRWDQVERRLGERGPDGPDVTGSIQSDPTGVAGYTGPPGGYGDGVNSYGGLPQGISGADIR
jgi:hypothetical protein